MNCYEVYDSACVRSNCFFVPNNCKQHCSTTPPQECGTCDDVLPYKSSAFNFKDHSPVVVPDTKVQITSMTLLQGICRCSLCREL